MISSRYETRLFAAMAKESALVKPVGLGNRRWTEGWIDGIIEGQIETALYLWRLMCLSTRLKGLKAVRYSFPALGSPSLIVSYSIGCSVQQDPLGSSSEDEDRIIE